MIVSILGFGSRGDIQPLAALAARGHEVRVRAEDGGRPVAAIERAARPDQRRQAPP